MPLKWQAMASTLLIMMAVTVVKHKVVKKVPHSMCRVGGDNAAKETWCARHQLQGLADPAGPVAGWHPEPHRKAQHAQKFRVYACQCMLRA